jgi:hypothetical protein
VHKQRVPVTGVGEGYDEGLPVVEHGDVGDASLVEYRVQAGAVVHLQVRQAANSRTGAGQSISQAWVSTLRRICSISSNCC